MTREFITPKELCEILGISMSSYYRNRLNETLPLYKIGKTYKHRYSDIEKYLRVS